MNKTVNKEELIAMISEKLVLYKADVKQIIDQLFVIITDEVKQGNEVKLPGLGTFMRVHKAARNGVNPATGQSLTISAKHSPKFKISKTFKDAVVA